MTAVNSFEPINAPQNPAQADDVTALRFADLALAKPILNALKQAGYVSPTPIQQKAIPAALAGRDLLLSAQTGSGKTAAFVLPILHRLATMGAKNPAVCAVILTPTRELALQVQDNVRRYSAQMKGVFSVPLVGGAAYGGQLRALRKGVQIIVATPGRFIDHLNAGRIDLSALKVLVLDEADRMLDMGFSEDIDTIINAAPTERQTIMSSATWDGAVGKIAERFTHNPERIAIKIESAHIDERVYFCDDFKHKNDILSEVLNNPEIKQAVIFAATKMSAERLASTLSEMGHRARYLHGDLPQAKRNRIVSEVKAGKCQFLVATDVAARGIDIANISHVVNYDLPRQPEDYVHRIGRCGRAGRTGRAINLCSMEDRNLLAAINRYLKRPMKSDVVLGLEPKKAGFERALDNNKRKRPSKKPHRHAAKKPTGRFKANDGAAFEVFGAERVTDGRFGVHEVVQATPKFKSEPKPNAKPKHSQPTRSARTAATSSQTAMHPPALGKTASTAQQCKSMQAGKKTRTGAQAKRATAPAHQTKGVVEILFHQTAPKRARRFGDK